MSATARHLAFALEALGETTNDVAEFLAAGGWTGLRSDGRACPIAIYLSSVVPNISDVYVTPYELVVVTGDGEEIDTALPVGPSDFVSAFDDGAYDDLAAVITDEFGEVTDDLER
ncbi:hypothetical protein [Catenuloplanes atrovinosus]|uniref:Uncharacterized protein n=1 Tax=Catenuloplanes atrovinosus TaxID=137266 RepID=A0AAE3YTK5_9ACTN|nr:hypothetical protein [Catenuloplanes atrovinosus]MDR7278395.1 hypothetical protein [Catenuloplanes atrovinosus]